MSGPYDYSQQSYSQYPAQGFQNQQSQYPQQGYSQQSQYNQHPSYDQNQNFGPPRRADSFGPPQAGGFQHGVQGHSYGQYDASNPQGHAAYYGSSDAYVQNQAYQNSMSQQNFNYSQSQPDISNHEFAKQSSDPQAPNYDASAPPMTETDRGFLGSVGGGIAGRYLGKKSGHGFLGTVGGAILGSLTEDYAKEKKKKHHHHSHHGSQSSWGGRH